MGHRQSDSVDEAAREAEATALEDRRTSFSSWLRNPKASSGFSDLMWPMMICARFAGFVQRHELGDHVVETLHGFDFCGIVTLVKNEFTETWLLPYCEPF